MRCLVVYDIPDDAARAKVADICLDYGLVRIQYSAFMGDISPNYQEELFLKIRRRIGERDANVQLFPICDRDLRQRRVLASGAKASRGKAPAARATKAGEADGPPKRATRTPEERAGRPNGAGRKSRARRTTSSTRDLELAGREA